MAISLFAQKVAATIERHGLLRGGELVLAAVSGGPDSMALLHALVELRERFGVGLHVITLDHGLRGEESRQDALFVQKHANSLGLGISVATADVPAVRQQRGGSIEMAARRARYGFYEALATQLHAHKVALGHTADDQAETILLRLLRGGELDALRGMPIARPVAPLSNATIIRPLLEVTRAEVLGYLAERNVPWRSDPSNADPTFLRNWVRHELLPLLEDRGEGIRSALVGAAGHTRTLCELIGRQAEALVAAEPGAARLDPARLAAAPRLVRREAIRRACAAAGGQGGLTRRALDAAEELLEAASGHRVALAGGLAAERVYDAILIHPLPGAPPRVALSLGVPGRVEVPQLGLWLEATPLSEPPPLRHHASRVTRHASGTSAPSRWEETVDLDAIGECLEVRTRRPGDRFVPLGQEGATKLKDFLIGQHIPRAERDRTLLVVGKCGIAWVVGLRLDARARLTPATRRCARLAAGPLHPC